MGALIAFSFIAGFFTALLGVVVLVVAGASEGP